MTRLGLGILDHGGREDAAQLLPHLSVQVLRTDGGRLFLLRAATDAGDLSDDAFDTLVDAHRRLASGDLAHGDSCRAAATFRGLGEFMTSTRPHEALEALRQALAHDPRYESSGSYLSGIGAAWSRAGEHAHAAAAYEQAAGCVDTPPDNAHDWADALLRSGMFEEALQATARHDVAGGYHGPRFRILAAVVAKVRSIAAVPYQRRRRMTAGEHEAFAGAPRTLAEHDQALRDFDALDPDIWWTRAWECSDGLDAFHTYLVAALGRRDAVVAWACAIFQGVHTGAADEFIDDIVTVASRIHGLALLREVENLAADDPDAMAMIREVIYRRADKELPTRPEILRTLAADGAYEIHHMQ